MHSAICSLLLIVQGAASTHLNVHGSLGTHHSLHAFLLVGFTPSLQGALSQTVMNVPGLGFSTQQIPLPEKTDHRSGLTIHISSTMVSNENISSTTVSNENISSTMVSNENISSTMVSNETNLSWENEGALLYFSVFHPHLTRGIKIWTTKINESKTSHSLCFNEHCIQVNCLDTINRPLLLTAYSNSSRDLEATVTINSGNDGNCEYHVDTLDIFVIVVVASPVLLLGLSRPAYRLHRRFKSFCNEGRKSKLRYSLGLQDSIPEKTTEDTEKTAPLVTDKAIEMKPINKETVVEISNASDKGNKETHNDSTKKNSIILSQIRSMLNDDEKDQTNKKEPKNDARIENNIEGASYDNTTIEIRE